MAADAKSFGSCCDTLKEAMADEEFDHLISVGDDGILYLSVGLIDVEEEEPGMVEYPMFHCPFCGKEVQTQAEIDAKGAGATN
jgi:hypothetical protein